MFRIADFTIEVPIKVKATDGGRVEGGRTIIRPTTGAIAAGGGAAIAGKSLATLGTIAASVGGILIIVSALDFIIKPVMQILKAILVLLFLPLIPIFIPIMKTLGKFVSAMAESQIALMVFVRKIFDFISGTDIGKAIGKVVTLPLEGLKATRDILTLTVSAWVDIIQENIDFWKFVFTQWVDIFKTFFSFIKFVAIQWRDILLTAWDFLKNIGLLIWTTILQPAWSWFSDIGERVWGIIKGGWDFIVTALKNVANALIDLFNNLPGISIPRLASGGIVTKPTLALIGESGPEAIIPLGKGNSFGSSITININKPVVRSESDLKLMAQLISRELQLRQKRRIS